MATRAFKPNPEDSILGDFQSEPEKAPSVMREDQPIFSRILALFGLFLVAAGAIGIAIHYYRLGGGTSWSYFLGINGGLISLGIGSLLLIWHAFYDGDFQIRTIYSFGGILLLAAGLMTRVIPIHGVTGALFLPLGVPLLALSFFFIIGSLRHPGELPISRFLLFVLLILGVSGIVGGFIGGLVRPHFVAGEGILLFLLGFLYLAGFLGMQDLPGDWGFNVGLGLGAMACVGLLSTLVRNFFLGGEFMVPTGFTFLGVSLVLGCISLGICSDFPLVVQTRRELASFFYSPVAYLVIMGMAVVAWVNFVMFINLSLGGPAPEPIVQGYVLSWIPVIMILFAIPILTMRLLSEEKRTGTLEVLLTAPVNEGTLVISKFLGSLIFYLITWTPFWVFLVSLRIANDQEFDFRPVIVFIFALASTGAGFIAMGLFFSSLTRNQIIAAMFTFVGMIGLFLPLWITRMVQNQTIRDICQNISFIELWAESLQGNLVPRSLLFHLGFAVFFLFLTYKVLESRKWK